MTASTGRGRGRGVRKPNETKARELARTLRGEGAGNWADLGTCRDQGRHQDEAVRDRHFPAGHELSTAYRDQAERAKAVCGWCPVRAECLAHALAAGEDEGVWGGTTPRERRAIRRAARTQTQAGA